MTRDDRPLLRLAHSPDPDDAFMWWPLFAIDGQPPRLHTGRFRFEQVTADIQTLNEWSQREGESSLEITAISAAQYPFVQQQYAVTCCGASMGEDYGPKFVAGSARSIDELLQGDPVIAIPGERTSAFATLCMMLKGRRFRHTVVPFEAIADRVAEGAYEAGVIIHEGQLTYAGQGLHLIADLGQWWWQQTRLPLPLGLNVVRRDLARLHGSGTLAEITSLLMCSIRYALDHRAESIDYALRFARNMPAALADRFISMYVNDFTMDLGEVGSQALQRFLGAAHEAGAVPETGNLDVIRPSRS
jgi:1,4-dihydroxy-6-naphthoate synthase